MHVRGARPDASAGHATRPQRQSSASAAVPLVRKEIRDDRDDGEEKVTEKSYREMSDEELRDAHREWEQRVRTAPGWSSAHFSACQLREVVREGARRGLELENRYPVVIGEEVQL